MRYALQALRSGKIGGPVGDVHVGTGSTMIKGTTDVTSTSWAGYADDDSSGNAYTKIKGSWVQPKVVGTCTGAPEVTGFWVGIDGYNTGTVEQDGTSDECYDGTGYYYDWYEMYPADYVNVSSIGAKDKITASVTDTAGSYVLSVTDSTNPGDSFSITETCGAACTDGSAEWIAEAPCCVGKSLYPLAAFRTWQVTNASVTSNVKGTISSFPNDAITMVSSTGDHDLVVPGPLNKKGTTFTDTFKAST